MLTLSSICLQAGNAYSVEFESVKYEIFTIRPADKNIRLYWTDPKGIRFRNFEALKNYIEAKKKKLIFATNAGIFTKSYEPLGLYVEAEHEIQPINTSAGHGNFFLKPNGIFYIGDGEYGVTKTSDYRDVAPHVQYATQSGPMLVIDRHIHPVFRKKSNSVYIRNGVGVDRSGNAIFAISNSPVNFYTFAQLFRDKLNCENALYLDGAISKMYLPQNGKTDLGGNFAVIIAYEE